MLTRKFNFLHLILSSLICCSAIFLFYWVNTPKKTIDSKAKSTTAIQPLPSCETSVHKLVGYTFIKPLLYNDKKCESVKYATLKLDIENLIKQYQSNGVVDKTSVYLKILNTEDFISIQENEVYHPASLFKLPILITYLKMEEKKPGVLNAEITYHNPNNAVPNQTFNSKQIVQGKTYTIKELLRYMIAYSDNNATAILNNMIDLELFKKTFSDLGLVEADLNGTNYTISAKNYSVFLNIIYNAGYLTIPHSEFVAELLNECDFKDGIQSGLSNDVKLIHKFGEWGSPVDSYIHELSESSIIYLDSSPYLLTIMTRGKEVKKLPPVMKDISKIIFDKLKADNI